MQNETKNYYFRCVNPSFLISALSVLLWRVILAISRRIVPKYRALMLPKSISALRTLVLKSEISIPSEPSFSNLKSGRLKLTNKWLSYDEMPDWFVEFEDQEVLNSLHRWNWLLYGLTEENEFTLLRKEGLSLIRSWLKCCLHIERFHSDAYSASERIVNASIFLLTTGDKTVPQDIKNAFQYMGLGIAKNLEYYEADMTGNHAFNNARGLLFAGIISGLPYAEDLAFEVFQERLPKLVTNDGFLREGSSHYHFLFTRWALEIKWIASRSCNEKIAAFMNLYSVNLVKKCWFFLVNTSDSGQWNIPLIGDISPDFPPEWLLSLPWSVLALDVFTPDTLPLFEGERGWGALFGVNNGGDEFKRIGTESYPDSYWHRIEFNQFIFFAHAESSSGQLRSDHRHLDLTSFVLYHSGRPILIDCGRSDYTNSALSRYGRSALSHNSLIVNGLSADVDGPSWLQVAYKTLNVETELFVHDRSAIFTIKHDGFDRIANMNLTHAREFKFTSDSFEIKDILTGTGTCGLRICFHYSPEMRVSEVMESGFSFENMSAIFHFDSDLDAKVLSGESEAQIGGLFSTSYGTVSRCTTINIDGVVKLPANVISKLNFNL